MNFTSKTLSLGFFWLAIAIFLSCADNQNLEFPSKDEVRQRYSSTGAVSSSSFGESSSSSEVVSSSSSSEPSSSSSDVYTSSSSSEVVSYSCGNYNPLTHYCHSDNKLYSCDDEPYNPSLKICCNDMINDLKTIHYGVEKSQFCDERDGKLYVKVDIGSKTWMAENLKHTGGRSYDNNNHYSDKYGKLYDWVTAMALSPECNSSSCASQINNTKHQGICPSGWHLPSKDEWAALVTAVGGKNVAGQKLKAKTEWLSDDDDPNVGKDNFGFAALPGGYCYSSYDEYWDDYDFICKDAGKDGYWWSNTEDEGEKNYHANRLKIDYNEKETNIFYDTKDKYFSVRCVKD